MSKNIKKKVSMYLTILLTILCLVGIIYSLVNIVIWKLDGDKVKEIINDMEEKSEIVEIEDSTNTETVEQEIPPAEDDPYWAFVKMKLIDVDFTELKQVNTDTVGWISVNGTNINYPFVQTDNNTYYLTHDFEKSTNSAGWVFLDYRNNAEFTDQNTIIYAHGRYDKTMFGTLRNALTNGWLNNTNNYVFKISTPKENSLWQVFSIYHIPVTSDYLKINFSSDEEYSNFIKIITDRSAHNFNTSVATNDKIITLSTCYNESERVVLHAKLIKYEKKY